MAAILPRAVGKSPLVGGQILDVITRGMYDNPLMVYREYVQNAVDSIDAANDAGLLRRGAGVVSISLCGKTRNVVIEDNGVGVHARMIRRTLVSIGASLKRSPRERGFRGIGRLGGLAYCEMLRFETRTSRSEPITVVDWDARRWRDADDALMHRASSVEKIIQGIVTIHKRPAHTQDPPHFFRVHLMNVHQFYSDELLNPSAVRNYLAQVAPVGYDTVNFSFAEEARRIALQVPGYQSYRIMLNGDSILRPYRDHIPVSKSRDDRITGISTFELKDANGEVLGLGLYADTNLTAAIPPSLGMQGIRVRRGNIQIGDERLLDDVFIERRFAVWHIGEIHIAGHKLRPNARRDGFEQTKNYERFLEQARALGRALSGLCRSSSRQRSINSRAKAIIREVEQLEASTLFIDGNHRTQVFRKLEARLHALARQCSNGLSERLSTLADNMRKAETSGRLLAEHIDKRSVGRLNSERLLQGLCRAVMEHYAATTSPEALVRRIIAPFAKPTSRAILGRRPRP